MEFNLNRSWDLMGFESYYKAIKERYSKTKDVVFMQNCPGLGDSLQFSTLPERYSDMGRDFYLHVANTTNNSEIEDLVWFSNPYVKKEKVDKTINCFYHQHLNAELSMHLGARNMVEWAELSHSFDIKNSKPKIYYDANTLSDLKDFSVLDIGGITVFRKNFYQLEQLLKNINSVIDKKNTLLVSSKYSNSEIDGNTLGMKQIQIKDIFHYCDVIKSCKEYYCLYSGGASLASAIREDGAFVFFPNIRAKKEIESGSHLFPNNRYYTSEGKFLNDMNIWRF